MGHASTAFAYQAKETKTMLRRILVAATLLCVAAYTQTTDSQGQDANTANVPQVTNSASTASAAEAKEGEAGVKPASETPAISTAAKPTTAPALAAALPYTRVLVNYSGTKEVTCPADHPVLVVASCDYSGLPIMWDKNSQLPPGSTSSTNWTHWLIPNAQNATGVHCVLPSTAFSSQARLLCGL
jgi:hypothetical protein